MSRDNTTLLQADNFEDLDDIDDLLLIEAGVKKKGHLRDNNIYLLNDMKDNYQYQIQEKNSEWWQQEGWKHSEIYVVDYWITR